MLRFAGDHRLVIDTGERMIVQTPSNPELYEELCIAYWHMNRKRDSYDCLDRIFELRPRDSSLLERSISNKLLFEKVHETDKWVYGCMYPTMYSGRATPVVTVTMTTCRRLPLFLRTIESFMRCCVDKHLIRECVIIDDNSSEEDRKTMEEFTKAYSVFPIRYIFKEPIDRGHAKSMQLLVSEVKTPYMLHLEDDWLFFDRLCISDMLEIMGSEEQVKQVAINKNYTSIPEKRIIGGQEKWTAGNLRYFVHEYCRTDEEKALFIAKHGAGPSCSYWPHFTLQPSLIDVKIFEDLSFEQVPHFEMAFATKYAHKGFKTAFIQGVTTRHIGKNAGDDEGQNAYELNDVSQF